MNCSRVNFTFYLDTATSSAAVKERVVIPPLPLWAFMTCSRVNFTFYVDTAI